MFRAMGRFGGRFMPHPRVKENDSGFLDSSATRFQELWPTAENRLPAHGFSNVAPVRTTVAACVTQAVSLLCVQTLVFALGGCCPRQSYKLVSSRILSTMRQTLVFGPIKRLLARASVHICVGMCPQQGYHGTYPGSGFVIDMPMNLTGAKALAGRKR